MPCDFPRSKIRFWHTPALRDGTQILPNPFHTTMPQTAIRAHEDDDDPPILEPRTPAPVTTPVNSFWQNTSDSDPTMMMILGDKRGFTTQSFLDLASEHFHCRTVEEFISVFQYHPKLCADVWNNMQELPDYDWSKPVHLLATLLFLKGETRFRLEYPIDLFLTVLNHIARLDAVSFKENFLASDLVTYSTHFQM